MGLPLNNHCLNNMEVVEMETVIPLQTVVELLEIWGLDGRGFTVTVKVSDREKQFGKPVLAVLT